MTRVTVAVPVALMDAANHVHVLLGNARQTNTYTGATWRNAAGDLFAASSGLWSDTQIAGVTNPDILAQLQAAGRIPAGVDVDLAAQAQAAFDLYDVADPAVLAVPGRIVAVTGDDPQAALAWLGLEPAPR